MLVGADLSPFVRAALLVFAELGFCVGCRVFEFCFFSGYLLIFHFASVTLVILNVHFVTATSVTANKTCMLVLNTYITVQLYKGGAGVRRLWV